MQLIYEISKLKNLVKHAEVYNQDLEVSVHLDVSIDLTKTIKCISYIIKHDYIK
jgi:hypothetical protein